jgi:hypothetical protein
VNARKIHEDTMPNVTIDPNATVDIKRQETVADAVKVAAELPMEEYAKRREAEMRGKPLPEVKVEKTDEAATTEKSAEATTEVKTDDAKKADVVEDPVAELEETHPGKKGISERFAKVTADRKAAEEAAKQAKAEADAAKKEAEEAKAEAARLKAEAEKAAAETKPQPIVPAEKDDPAPARPDRAKFTDPDEFDKAMAEYSQAAAAHAARDVIRKANATAEAEKAKKDEADKKAREEETQKQVQQRVTELHRSFKEKVEKGKTEYPDYDEKVTNNETLELRNDIFFAVENSDIPHHLLYRLATNPEETASLNKMDPAAAYMKLGEIQAEIRIARKPKPTQAARPESPIGNRTSPDRKTPDQETMAEYGARREREMAEERAQSARRHGNRP